MANPQSAGIPAQPQHRRNKHHRQRAQWALLFAVLVLVPWAIVKGFQYIKAATEARLAKEDVVVPVVEEQRKTIEEMTTSELIDYSLALKNKRGTSLPEQMEWVNEKLAISRLLLARTDDTRAQKEATLYRMEALQRLSNINREFRLHNDTVDSELFELARANLKHPDPEVSKIASVTIMLTAIHVFTVEPDDGTLKKALDQCRTVATELNEDAEVASAIFQYALSMSRSERLVDDSVLFFNVVIDTYRESPDAGCRQIANEAFSEILLGDRGRDPRMAQVLLASLKDRLRQGRTTIEQEFINRIRFSMRPEFLDPNGFDQMFAMLEMLTAFGMADAASSLTSELNPFLERNPEIEGNAEFSVELGDLELRVAQLNHPMDFSSLSSVLSERGILENRDRPSLLVFWSPDDPDSTRMISGLYGQSLKRELQIVAVCTEPSAGSESLLAKFAKEMPDFDFAIVPERDVPGSLLARFPVPQLPYLALVNADGELVSCNPDPRDIGRLLETQAN